MMDKDTKIITTKEKKLIGMTLEMSFANNKTRELWTSFMPRRTEVKNAVNDDLVSLQMYEHGFFEHFDPNKTFRKWTLREVDSFENIPDGMVSFELPAGEYAVFIYKGLLARAQSFFDYIFREWLPNSEYRLDNRPHFEVLGSKYKNDDPESEEEVWIPVKKK